MLRNVKKLSVMMLVVALVIGLFSPINVAYAAERVTITVLGTADIHGTIFNWSYEDNRVDDRGGMVKLATIVEQVREENPNTILIDNGDTIQGTLLTDDLFNTVLIDEPHPVIKSMNLMNYDAMTLGNHEFNFGTDLIKKIEAEANFPLLSANTFYKADDSYFVEPYTIVELNGIKVGIIGLTTPNIPVWDGPKVTNLKFNAMHEEAERLYKELTEEKGVDIVIATAHAGLEGRYENEGSKASLITEKVPQLAMMLLGHDHDTKNMEVNGVPVVAPRNAAREIARVDITLEKQGDKWVIVDRKAEIIVAQDFEANADLADALKSEQQRTLDFISNTVATATADFVPEYEVKSLYLPAAQLMDSAVIDLINNVQLEYTGADIAAAALFDNYSNIKEGPVSYGDIFGIYKYPNTLYAVEVTGSELKDYMEWSASYYNTYQPGDITISFNPEIRGYNYDMFQGVDYKIDISKEPGNRIVDLTFKGEPVKDDQVFKLAINNYRFSGLENLGIISNDAYFVSDPKSLRSYILDYISEKGILEPEVDNNWEVIGAPLTHWAREDAVNLINKEIFEIPAHERSWNAHSINLEKQTTRGEYVKALVKALGADLPTIPDIEEYRFSDVEANLAPYIEAAYLLDITGGVSETSFAPNEKVTREQAFVFLIRALNLADEYDIAVLDQFNDKDKISPWAKESMAAAVQLGLVGGYSDGTFRPDAVIKWGEMAKILNSYLVDFDKISIVHTNDMHGRVLYNQSAGEMGLAKIATIVDNIKKDNTNTLLFDMGDTFHGTNYVVFNDGDAAVKAMNLMGYDAMVPGNHDFNYGQKRLLELVDAAKFPVISANVVKNNEETLLKPYVIIEEMGKKIALIGVTATDTAVKTHPNNTVGITFEDEVEVVQSYVNELEGTVDHIIVLSHAGNDTDERIAAEVSGVDLILGGHSHSTYEKPVRIADTYVTQAYEHGKAVGITNILYYNGKFIGVNGHLVRDNSNIKPKAEVDALLNIYKSEVETALQEVIAEVDVTLDGAREDVRVKETNLGNLITDAMRQAVGAEVAFTNGGGIRASVPEGEVTLEHIMTVLPFANTVVKMEMTGEQLLKSLEYSVRLYPEQNGGFLHISGMTFTYDPSKPEGEKVVEVLIAGEALVLDEIYTVATNDFVAAGGDGYEWLKEAKILADTGEVLSTTVINYLQTGVEIPTVEGRISIVE
ncbi:5'-nucleotidase C-terminal domain-containing protein [Alkaliphilus peptidifermentans]|uniref:2',3'-cyclic-nucleotide 2'-phosphodiesterase / 3'-nucleotidase n=1 Tax=Alkaliphilus peptidifermentans DSM 18978 TaxID=1120976 RepID=A0A1G5K1T7_9FIRM|nr:5'-nucleotidase C-terminal domain-containing protein [Alkaliphilus peptidifermentans]SCY94424.1 2',3'-cyclic-nucleotide 2'-phosphodiesterase / 3'-nucleotidase [Alkaliphilus peptidifermentans DSM 18978]